MEFKNKKIAVIGMGVSNIPLIDYLHEKKQMYQYLMTEKKIKFQKIF